jgi:hypothetical protein
MRIGVQREPTALIQQRSPSVRLPRLRLTRVGHRVADVRHDPSTGQQEIRSERISYEVEVALPNGRRISIGLGRRGSAK